VRLVGIARSLVPFSVPHLILVVLRFTRTLVAAVTHAVNVPVNVPPFRCVRSHARTLTALPRCYFYGLVQLRLLPLRFTARDTHGSHVHRLVAHA